MRGIIFGGRRILRPGGYSVVDTETMVAISAGGFKILVAVGECTKGKPKTLLAFNDPTEAKNRLGSGDLLKAMQIAWAPSTTLAGADLIYAMRVNAATQASHILQDATPAAAITLTAREYGDIPYQVKVEAGTGGKVIVTITDGTTTEILPEFATNTEIVDYINKYSALVTATKTGDTIINTVLALTSFTTAGTNPAATDTDWQDAIAVLANFNKANVGVVPVTDTEATQALFKADALAACSNRKERRIFVGHALGESVDAIILRAKNLGTKKALLATPGIKSAVSGTLETLSSVFTAAALAGMWAGNDSAEPLTFDYLNCLGLEKVYGDELDALLEGGVTPIEEVSDGYRVALAQTTHLSDDNIASIELSCDTLADEMSIELRTSIEKKFVGKKPSATQNTSVYNYAISILNKFVREGKLVANEETGTPAYRNVKVVKSGMARYVEWEGSVATPDNYILITSHITTA